MKHLNPRFSYTKNLGTNGKVRQAIKSGILIKGLCRDCGSLDVVGHHHDYSKPLDVIWLCRKHHYAEHHKIKY